MLIQKNSKKQWDVWMGIAIWYFVAQGYTVSVPLTDSQDYDLIIDTSEWLKSVQVKTTRFKKLDKYIVNLKVSGWNRTGTTTKLFTENNSDFLFVLTEQGTKYLIPNINLPWRSLMLGKQQDKFIVS